jgi:hypothetical protein
MLQTSPLFEPAEALYERVFREIKPRTKPPAFLVEFKKYANVSSTIRVNAERTQIHVKISDQLEGAPAPVQEALAYILVSKLYRKAIPKKYNHRYKLFLNRNDTRRRALLVRQIRGRKVILGADVEYYDLAEVFEDLNRRFFHGLLARPALSWSRARSRWLLGHFDPAHNDIIISKVFDGPKVPRFAVEYIDYHEMLHLKHPTEYRTKQRCVHTKAFKAEEKLFPQFREATAFLKLL